MSASPLKALIVDDESLARQELQFLLEDAGEVEVLAAASNGIEAVELIGQHEPDVVFLDVRMPGLDGFAVLRKLIAQDAERKLPQIVFATAFDQYAVKAFEVNAVDYLLKPFDEARILQTIAKVRDRLASANPAGSSAEAKLDALLRMVEERSSTPPSSARSGKVVVRSGNRLLLVDQRDVCFASIEGGTITVVTTKGKGDSNCRTLEELADQLDAEQFWRAHRSYLVNIQHIHEVMPWFHSSFQLKMDDKEATEVPVSRSQTKHLRELFNL
ncbi:LytR/AlgR family response regulator transcription factor [Granulicella cerasi]|uniref:LytR/AlgR family response regulator transcription factor n=1 Tax=Granulicella cerasi TaxID=741063 RepID=A0ABW1Z8G5_9BACT|nr:response regulator [Granulicella cerasi]